MFGHAQVCLSVFLIATLWGEMQKVVVIGSTGSGKSTLAEQIAMRLDLPYIPTDPLYWGENWRQVPLAEVHAQIDVVTAQPQWVLDGNFDAARELVWGRADTLIWLDYSRHLVWSRLVRRNVGWFLSGAPTWSGNRMTLAIALSGVRHGLRGYGAKRREYSAVLPLYQRTHVFRFGRPRDTALWLAQLEPSLQAQQKPPL